MHHLLKITLAFQLLYWCWEWEKKMWCSKVRTVKREEMSNARGQTHLLSALEDGCSSSSAQMFLHFQVPGSSPWALALPDRSSAGQLCWRQWQWGHALFLGKVRHFLNPPNACIFKFLWVRDKFGHYFGYWGRTGQDGSQFSLCSPLCCTIHTFLGTASVIFKMVISLILVLREKSGPCLVPESKPHM